MEVASLTEPDPLPDVDLDVRVVEAPERETWCILCGVPIEADSGPAVFLKGGWERVCRRCTRTRDPVALNELKWRRRDWQSETDWGQQRNPDRAASRPGHMIDPEQNQRGRNGKS